MITIVTLHLKDVEVARMCEIIAVTNNSINLEGAAIDDELQLCMFADLVGDETVADCMVVPQALRKRKRAKTVPRL